MGIYITQILPKNPHKSPQIPINPSMDLLLMGQMKILHFSICYIAFLCMLMEINGDYWRLMEINGTFQLPVNLH